MLRATIVSPDAEMSSRLADLIRGMGRVGLMKSADRYLSGYDLERFLRANAPQIVFLGIEELDRAKEMLKGIEETLAWLSGSRDRSRLRPSGSPEPDAHRRSRVHGLSV